MAACRAVGAAFDEAVTLTALGDVLAGDGSGGVAAREAWQAALAIFDRLSGQLAQAQAGQVKGRLAAQG